MERASNSTKKLENAQTMKIALAYVMFVSHMRTTKTSTQKKNTFKSTMNHVDI